MAGYPNVPIALHIVVEAVNAAIAFLHAAAELGLALHLGKKSKRSRKETVCVSQQKVAH
jgi:hypothetical protein